MTSPLPQVQYLIAFNNGPLDDPGLITTVAAVGTVGGENEWTDITSYVLGHNLDRGRQHELDQFEAGTLQLTLGNFSAQFNPWNESGPYYGLLQPGKILRYQVTWSGTTYVRFTGHIDAIPTNWPDPISAGAQIHASDALRLFNRTAILPAYYRRQVGDGATSAWMMNDAAKSGVLRDLIASDNLIVGSVDAPTLGVAGFLAGDSSTACEWPNSGLGSIANVSGTFDIAGDWSLEFIAQYATDAFIDDPGALAFEAYYDASGTASLAVGIGPDTAGGTAVGGSAVYVTTSGATISVGFGPAMTDGAAHHYAISWNGTELVTYVDGVQVGSSSSNLSVGITNTLATPGVAVNVIDGQGPFTTQGLGLYCGTALSAAEVAVHYEMFAWPQQTSDQRVATVLDGIGWSTGARDLDTGCSQIQAVGTTSFTNVKALNHLQGVETTEGGALYMLENGQVRFVSRADLFAASIFRSVQATFGDEPTEGQIPFQPAPQLGMDDLDVYNDATASRQGGQQLGASNLASQEEYGSQTWQPPATCLGISDEELQNRLQYVVTALAEPHERLASIDVKITDLIEPNLVGAVMALGLLYMVQVERSGIVGGGTAFSEIGNIEHISEVVTVNDWTVTFGLAYADPTQYFEWGTSEWGDTTTWLY